MAEHDPITEQPSTPVTEVCAAARRLATELPGPLRRVRVSAGEVAVEVRWGPTVVPLAAAPVPVGAAPAAASAPVEPDPGRALVLSPMVGTFYRAPEPGAAPFVAVGDAVEAGQVIGIVEAMKLMNPIVTEVAGTVAEVLAADGDPVEYAHPLVALVTD